MKIRPSIRSYFLVAMLFAGTVTIGVLTVTAVRYFFSGMDTAMTEFFRSQVSELPLGNNNAPLQMDELTIAAKWEDLPQQIQQNWHADDLELGQLHKKIEATAILSPPEFGYFVMKVVRNEEVRFISLVLDDLDANQRLNEEVPPFFYIILTGFAAIIFFAVVLIVVQRKISSPVEQLRDWAKSLDKDQLTQPVPNFHYSELNSLAGIIKSSLSSVQESLEREQRFLGYASHELRTPIAVTRTNSELLRKMITKEIAPEKQIEVLDRIERAVFTMTDLTETLLLLNRQEDKSLPSRTLKVGDLIKQIESELHYLLQEKMVDVSVSVDDSEMVLPEGLCRIVITNLIRNAFQHTQHGEVSIEQSGSDFSIINRNVNAPKAQDDLGFGLGLELTQRLIAQYGWQYQTTQSNDGWRVEVVFDTAT
ncbi:sensor histidine kinase [Photobacterium rosenbergii]|uniref:sensor histidine kinase n=1 Tax=Photobacterium rosenbergii TaxID=294936 RepID=UPI001C99AC5D|nr:HAMP domain-containing sensor histidine kinase [Photobacterium rosenbergii]MBY5948350.1 HAMP domain-containing histidine kinase [Photobacterium rosenbergii]